MSGIDPIETFRLEAAELLDVLEQALLDLETRPHDSELVGLAFRALHTLKGSGAMFGFSAVSTFIHEFETAFDRVRKGEAPISIALIKAALQARDHVAALIDNENSNPGRGAAILAALSSAMNGSSAIDADDHAEAEESAAVWQIRFKLPSDALIRGTNPILLLDELSELGDCVITADVSDLPPLEVLEPQTSYLAWTVHLSADVERDVLEDVFLFVRDDMELSIDRIGPATSEGTNAAAAEPQPAAAIADAPSANRNDKNATIRVSAERLDQLMDRVGELVIAQARLSQLAQAIGNAGLVGVAEEIERLTSGLRDTTMGTRVVPIGTLFGRFRRLVHDLSHELGKPIDFVTGGEETELDKTVIEQLADPLVHLIRNAVDHGLEGGASRVAAGKSETGTLRLSAGYRGAEVAIVVSDDGHGLDANRIRHRAVEAGMIAETSVVADADLYRMIFQPGFSTAREVTSLSGRGVGMDVVKRTIDGLRGSIDIDTIPGKGTSVTLRLPLTLAIIDGLLVRIGTERYTIPLAAVEECVELPRGRDADASTRSFLNLRGELVPFLRLREVFGAQSEADEYQKIVVVSSGTTRVGLIVDQIIGNNQTVIKQLSRLHSGLKTFSGATILGDGTVALILDVMNLVGFGQSIEAGRRDRTMGKAA